MASTNSRSIGASNCKNSSWLTAPCAHAGFAMLSAGSIRQKNTINILLKNVADVTVAGISFYLLGFGFAYGTSESGGNAFIGNSDFALSSTAHTGGYHIWLFQVWLHRTHVWLYSTQLFQEIKSLRSSSQGFFLWLHELCCVAFLPGPELCARAGWHLNGR